MSLGSVRGQGVMSALLLRACALLLASIGQRMVTLRIKALCQAL